MSIKGLQVLNCVWYRERVCPGCTWKLSTLNNNVKRTNKVFVRIIVIVLCHVAINFYPAVGYIELQVLAYVMMMLHTGMDKAVCNQCVIQ